MQTPRLHQDTIDRVKERADIVDVISEKVVLRKRGKDFLGLCPFHEEKSPSFTVSPSKQMYYCFGCQAGGNAIKFLMEVDKRPFADVVLDLARRYQVSVQTLEPEQQQEWQRGVALRDQLYEILAIAAGFYQHALRQSQGQQALEYLKTQRHLSEETIQQFQLGYAPVGWETLYSYLVEQKSYSVQLVEKAGLIKHRKTGDGYIDQFRDRLIIPIRDTQGRVIGFGGRTLADEQPKYLNSPETELFNKGKTLFALDKAKDAISKQDRAVVVEGYFDAIALHQSGITNAVASLGTALSLDQIRQLLRYTESKQIVLNFDADAAGTKAAERAIGEVADLAYKGQVQLRILNLPDGKDADEFLTKSDPETYHHLLTTAPLWIDWQIEQTLVNKDISQADQFQQVTGEIVNLLRNIDNQSTRTHYISQCAEKLSKGDARLVPLLVENLRTQVKRSQQPLAKGTTKTQQPQLLPIAAERNLLEQAEALLLRIFLHAPDYRQAVVDALEARDLLFCLSHHRFLWQQILELQDSLTTHATSDLISLLQDRCVEFPNELALISHLFHLDEKTQQDLLRAEALIRAAAACLEEVQCEKHRRYCLEQWQKLASTDPERSQYYYHEFYSAQQRIKELKQQRQFNFLEVTQIGS